jgi:hypothetical protein
MAINSNGNALDFIPHDGNYVAQTVVLNPRNLWWAARLIVVKDSLSTKTPPAPPAPGSSWSVWYNSQPAVAAQMLWFSLRRYHISQQRRNAVRPGHLTAAREGDIRVSYGMKYIETYQQTHSVL